MSEPVFKAGYLPGLDASEVIWHRWTLGTPDAPWLVDLPELSAEQMTSMAQRVQQASGQHLKTMPVSDILRVLDIAIARLLDRRDPYRQALERLLPLATGFDAEMVRLNLTSYLQTFRGLQLQRFVAEDFANPKVLDEFQPRAQGGWCKAFGPELLVHVWAGNVPALPLWSFVSGLLVKAGSLGKVSRAEPVFATLFAHLLAEVEPRWRDCFTVVWWPSGTAKERHAFALADVVLAYGGNPALQVMQAYIPATTRFLPHGHKLSFGMVSAAALSVNKAPAVARQAALDVARFDQQGCYSPHMFYVQRGAAVSPSDFAQNLAAELAGLQHQLPRRALSLEESAQIGAWRERHELAALNETGHHPQAHTVLGNESSMSTVVFSDQLLPLSAGPLNRNILVVAVDSLDEVMPLVSAQRHYLQTAGLAAAPEELLHLGQGLGAAGVTRVCALGAMTSPEAGWHHDGRFNLLDLVRMVDIDASTEREAQRFTSYAP